MTAKEVFEYTKESAYNNVIAEIIRMAQRGEYCSAVVAVFETFANEVEAKLKEKGFEVTLYTNKNMYKEFLVRWNQNKE